LKTKALRSRTRQPEALFERILKKIEGLKNDIVYIDECEHSHYGLVVDEFILSDISVTGPVGLRHSVASPANLAL
jgi:hypothetical protein